MSVPYHSAVKRPARRTILKVLLLLVAGAAVNVAVAWGCMLGIDIRSLSSRDSMERFAPNYVWEVCARDGAGRGVRESHVWSGTIRSNWQHVDFEELIPDWGRLRRPTFPERNPDEFEVPILNMHYVDDAAGWPMLSLWTAWGVDQLPSPVRPMETDRFSIVIDAAQRMALPLRPI